MEGDLIHIHRALLPLSWLYGLGVGLRGALYDAGLIRSHAFPLPVICVGNITVGGTGKTPHTEYLLRLLMPEWRVAVLSRGYKRRSRGYQLASASTPMPRIGDEPWQMKHKFPEAYVAVDRDRCHGIRRLLADPETRDLDVVLLDDAFQHRRVRPSLNIVLVDYHRLVTDDCLLPAGRLREGTAALRRAHIVVVTKCPRSTTPMGFRVVQKALSLLPCQQLFFSTLRYGLLTPLFGGTARSIDLIDQHEHVLLLTGIASPEQMMLDLAPYTRRVTPLSFPDHHAFTAADVRRIEEAFQALPEPRLVITTEKDASRLIQIHDFSPALRQSIYTLPVEVEIMRDEANTFNETILSHVRTHQRNSGVAPRTAQ